jgi:riboflavin kinase/FMN adenylyltransferase
MDCKASGGKPQGKPYTASFCRQPFVNHRRNMKISWSWASPVIPQPSAAPDLRTTAATGSTARGAAVAIGSFDGLHLGHQALIRHLKQAAKDSDLESVVCSFCPHPRKFFQPLKAPGLILPLRDKLRTLAAAGLDRTHLLRFNAAMASLSPEDFVQLILVKRLNAKLVIVGEDFRFGHKRAGDLNRLTELGLSHGFAVQGVSEIQYGGERVSSSRLRETLLAGELALARQLLGRPYQLSGRVVRGQRLGRELGFPTLNLKMPEDLVASGIFAVWVEGLDRKPLAGVASLGRRPTVESGGRLILEVHVLDWSAQAYDQHVRVSLVERIRPEMRFDNLEDMTQQMHQDLQQARALLKA